MVAQAVPDPSLLPVSRPEFAVRDVFERQVQLEHEWSRLEAASLGIFEGPGCRGKVLCDLQGFLNERVGVGKFFGGALFRAPRYRVVRAQGAPPHEMKVTFRIGLFVVTLNYVGYDRRPALRVDVQADDLPASIAKGLADAASPGK